MPDISGKIPGCLHGNVGVISQHLHAQVGSRVSHLDADGSKADDTQLLSLDLMARKLLLLLLGKLCNLLVLPLGLDPVHASYNIPGCHQKSGDYQLLHAVCIGSRSIEHYNPLLRALSQGNVVDSGSRPGNGM